MHITDVNTISLSPKSHVNYRDVVDKGEWFVGFDSSVTRLPEAAISRSRKREPPQYHENDPQTMNISCSGSLMNKSSDAEFHSGSRSHSTAPENQHLSQASQLGT